MKQPTLFSGRNDSEFNVRHREFGAKGDGVADDTTAFSLWCAAINKAGGGIGVIPPGAYKVTPAKAVHRSSAVTAVALCAFRNLTGFQLRCSGATIVDGNTYSRDEGIFASFRACKRLELEPIKFVSHSVAGVAQGLIGYYFLERTTQVYCAVEMVGGQKAVFINREFAEPPTHVSSRFDLHIRATNTLYPLLCRFSGNDVEAWIDATGCGRNFFLIGCKNHQIHVKSKNQTGATIIAAYSGLGCCDIEVWYSDTHSDTNVAASEAILLQWSDQSPATHRNIKLHLDVNNPPTSPFFHTCAINKVDNRGHPDIIGRGHILDGLLIDGRSRQVDAVDHLRVFGAFGGNDQVADVSLRDLTLGSTGESNIHLGNLFRAQVDESLFERVYTDGGLYASEAFTVIEATDTLPVVIRTDAGNDIFDGMSVTISGVAGNPAANGTFFCRRISNTTFALYKDLALGAAVPGSGAYVSGGSGYVVGTSKKKTTYLHCTAKEVTAGVADNGVADYVSSTITRGARVSSTMKRYKGGTTINGVPQPTARRQPLLEVE